MSGVSPAPPDAISDDAPPPEPPAIPVLFDDRLNSKTRGCVEEYNLSPDNYFLLTVPPLVWNGWKGLGEDLSIVANCASIPHDPDEIERKPAWDERIPYDWNARINET